MLQLSGQAQSGNTVQQSRQQRKEQASNTPLQPALYAPVIQIPTPCVWQAALSRDLSGTLSVQTASNCKAQCGVTVHLGWLGIQEPFLAH